ncbi:ABC transporter ATP-binding protein [Candidatus Woesearchaeota archaeon]|nr:ABC transporter ATP-binding protein [Candidatus Woesearchaeota archaeon]
MVDSRVIEFKGIRKEFKNKVVLDNVNLSIRKGEIFGIIGLSGSGKTTLFNTLIGFLEPEEGEITYFEEGIQEQIKKDSKIVKTEFGFATQDPSFYPKLTAEENLDHFGALYKIKKKVREEYIDYLLKLVSLREARDTISSSLSGGMQKRLTIACALIHNPKVLILDEPTADLDPYLRNKTWDVIRNIKKQGTTVILSSHFLDEVDLLCDRIAILHNGVILEIGTPDELKDKYSKNEEIELETEPGDYDRIQKNIKKSNLPISKILRKADKMVLYTPRPEYTLHKLLNIIEDMKEELIHVDVNKPSLAEVFESLTYKSVRLEK